MAVPPSDEQNSPIEKVLCSPYKTKFGARMKSRYDHRSHGVLLVAQGLSCREVAKLLGDAPRTVAYCVRQFEEEGLAGLAEGERPGRMRRLSKGQLEEAALALRKSPSDCGLLLNIWERKTFSQFVSSQWGHHTRGTSEPANIRATWVSSPEASAENRSCRSQGTAEI